MTHSLLIVDDDPTSRSRLSAMATANRIPHRLAVDGEDAWEQFVTESARIVITDISMPKLDGLGLLARIREFAPLPMSLF